MFVDRLFWVLMICGAGMTFFFGLLVAFVPYMAYVKVVIFSEMDVISPPYVLFSELEFKFHGSTVGMLISSAGGFLVLVQAIRQINKLSPLIPAGNIAGIIGFLVTQPHDPRLAYFDVSIPIPWTGTCLALLGVMLMFGSSVYRFHVIPKVTLLGIPMFLVPVMLYPFLTVTQYFSLIESIFRSSLANMLISLSTILGLVLILSGNMAAIWKTSVRLRTRFFRSRKNCSL